MTARPAFLLFLLVTATLPAGCGGEPEPAPPPKPRGIVGRKTLEVLDAPAAIAAGTHTLAQGKIGEGSPLGGGGLGNDPISQSLNALGGATGFVGRVPMQQWVDAQQALTGEFPTHEQLAAFLAANRQYALPMPRLSQRYGYDQTAGAMVLLDVVDWTPAVGGSADVNDPAPSPPAAPADAPPDAAAG